MQASIFRRAASLCLALVLMLSALPMSALAAQTTDSDFTLIELKGTDVTLDETVFEYTGRPIEPNVTVRVKDQLLTRDKDYSLTFQNNLATGTGTVTVQGIATASATVGYTGKVEIPFTINPKLTEILGTDVTIDGTDFSYTGEAIEPAITVKVEGVTLTAGEDYSVAYENNIQPGTATVTVRGLVAEGANTGYTGTVVIDFHIQPAIQPEQPEEMPDEKPEEQPEEKPEEYPLVEIQPGDVSISGNSFPYTGKPIEPQITVTVDGKVLTAGKDYSLTYSNNVEVGTGIATVSGIATATENGGYTGTVEVKFSIVHTEETYPLTEIKGTDVIIEDTKFHYTGKAIEPKITVTVDGKVLQLGRDYSLNYINNIQPGTATAIVTGIATATENGGYTGEVRIDFTIVEVPEKAEYKITKGSSSVWNKDSGKNLSFTANGAYADFTGVTINGKILDSKYYTVKEGSTIVTLKHSFLEKLELGSYTIALTFNDGEASGTFRIAEALEDLNPKTGDSIHLATAILFISLTGLIGAAFAYRKKLWK